MSNNSLNRKMFIGNLENNNLDSLLNSIEVINYKIDNFYAILDLIKTINNKIDKLSNKEEEKIFDENKYFEEFLSNYPVVKIIKNLIRRGKIKSTVIKPFCNKKDFIPYFLKILKNTVCSGESQLAIGACYNNVSLSKFISSVVELKELVISAECFYKLSMKKFFIEKLVNSGKSRDSINKLQHYGKNVKHSETDTFNFRDSIL